MDVNSPPVTPWMSTETKAKAMLHLTEGEKDEYKVYQINFRINDSVVYRLILYLFELFIEDLLCSIL